MAASPQTAEGRFPRARPWKTGGMSESNHDLREDDPQLVDPDLADTDPENADTGGLAGGGGPAATIQGDELGGEGEHLADTEHGV
jgi:hypothetical protein